MYRLLRIIRRLTLVSNFSFFSCSQSNIKASVFLLKCSHSLVATSFSLTAASNSKLKIQITSSQQKWKNMLDVRVHLLRGYTSLTRWYLFRRERVVLSLLHSRGWVLWVETPSASWPLMTASLGRTSAPARCRRSNGSHSLLLFHWLEHAGLAGSHCCWERWTLSWRQVRVVNFAILPQAQ